MKRIVPILVLLILVFGVAAQSAEELKPSINFQEGYIIAEGIGVMPPTAAEMSQGIALARLAAKVDAQRNLLEIIAGLKLNSETSVVNLMANDLIRTQVIGVLQGAQIVPGSEYFQQGIYHLELRVDIKNLNEVLNPVGTAQASATQGQTFLTGLALDARGFDVTAPEVLEIRNTTGDLIYSAIGASAQPIPLLKMSKDQALADARVGTNPLIITVTRTSTDGSVVYVSDEDGKKILQSLEGTDVFMLTKIVVFFGGAN